MNLTHLENLGSILDFIGSGATLLQNFGVISSTTGSLITEITSTASQIVEGKKSVVSSTDSTTSPTSNQSTLDAVANDINAAAQTTQTVSTLDTVANTTNAVVGAIEEVANNPKNVSSDAAALSQAASAVASAINSPKITEVANTVSTVAQDAGAIANEVQTVGKTVSLPNILNAVTSAVEALEKL